MKTARWPDEWLGRAAPARRELWRGVEAQHQVATMRLVDSLQEQQLLEQVLEESKPPLPPPAVRQHYLIATPFRYTSPHASRFRPAGEPGIWYGADEPRTVCAEIAWWRWKNLSDSEGLLDEPVVTEHTFFQARFKGLELDLTAAPWNALRSTWRDPVEYGECHRLAAKARASKPAIEAIRYESARRERGACCAVLAPRALSLAALHRQQTWICKTMAHRVMLTHEGETYQFEMTGRAGLAP